MALTSHTDTICALSTPPGKSALAMVRMTGTDAIAIAAKIIREPEELFVAQGGATIYTDVLSKSGETLDDVVVTVFRSPKSFTGDDVVEITTHGSELIASEVANLLTSHGARLAEPGEFSRRAWMNGKMSLEEVEQIALRVDASSEQALHNAANVVRRKFERLRNAYDTVIEALALVNAEIDFGESDHIDASGFTKKLDETKQILQDLLEAAENKALDKGYISVALVGPPNVGKSSIFNALLRYERSIVSHIPGTTRDYVEAYMSLHGRRIKIIDTAGIRSANDEIESRGIALGAEAKQDADIILRITDIDSRNVVAQQNETLIHNKCDVDNFVNGISISALDDNIDPLVKFLERTIDSFDTGSSSLAISTGEAERLGNVLTKLSQISPAEEPTLVAEQLRSASGEIGELVGLNAGEESLSYIFSKMCIGK
jgi:tRNA modification GTPase